MKKPFYTRNQILFYHDKTEVEFQKDIYERYDGMVVRQTAVHLADELWNTYPYAPVSDWILTHLSAKNNQQIVDIGCGVGRLIAIVAKQLKEGQFYGIDYSYQMLRRAHEYWINGQTIELDWSNHGLKKIQLVGEEIPHLQFNLAKAEHLPFSDNKFDVVMSSFLIDRVDDPLKSLKEMYRILKPDGQLLLVTPLNFKRAKHWEIFFPISQFVKQVESIGFEIEDLKTDITIKEPIDAQGNFVQWNCIAIAASKNAPNNS